MLVVFTPEPQADMFDEVEAAGSLTDPSEYEEAGTETETEGVSP